MLRQARREKNRLAEGGAPLHQQSAANVNFALSKMNFGLSNLGGGCDPQADQARAREPRPDLR
jgi:hypothetical protein